MKEKAENVSCPHCLEINAPSRTNCVKCGGPLLAISTIGPFERIATHGFAQREAVTRPKRLIVVIGVWMLWLPVLLACVIPVFSSQDAAFVLLPLAIIPFVLILKTTRNYIKYRKEIALNNSVEDIGANRTKSSR